MKDLEKVNASQLFSFWKNLSIGMIVVIKATSTCMVVPYAIFYCMIVYAFLSIILNVLDIWSIIHVPKELSFFNDPYIPALMLDPVCLVVLAIFYMRRNKLAICIDCKISKGLSLERGKLGEILNVESRLQLINLICLFAVLSAIIWIYYFVWYYQHALVNSRDWYIFVWINIIAFILDEIYFASRYYNIYLGLRENGEIITEAELSDMTMKTYLRFYVVCGNKIFINTKVADAHHSNRFVIDTPFVTKRNVNGITSGEVHGIIQKLTGVIDGELRFCYGRKSPDMNIVGEWLDFELMKVIYNEKPNTVSSIMLTDISRIVTIILTQKLFDERGYRKMKIKSYHPTFDLPEVRAKNYDFQDDKWLRIAMYNSDIRGYHIRRLKINRQKDNKGGEWQ